METIARRMPGTLPRRRTLPPKQRLKQAEKHAWRCFLVIVICAFLNLVLAIGNAHGVPMNTARVTIIQIAFTLFSGMAILGNPVPLQRQEQTVLGIISLFLVISTIVNGLDVKSIYNCMIIPLYIALGRSARWTKPSWMHFLIGAVTAVVLFEIFFSDKYNTFVAPGKYFLATREWVANGEVNESLKQGLYSGAYRGGGSFFALADHRISGPFLEPLSLGYFGFLMAVYYSALYNGKVIYRLAGIGTALFLSLASDSRAASAMIVIGSAILLTRIKLPKPSMWLAPVAVLFLSWLYYMLSSGDSSGDTIYRLSLTFDGLRTYSVWDIIIGNVWSEQIGDTGIIYVIHCMTLVGLLFAPIYYSGAITREQGTNPTFFAVMGFYITTTLLFGLALFSIKTASLLGYLIGIASWSGAITRTSVIPRGVKRKQLRGRVPYASGFARHTPSTPQGGNFSAVSRGNVGV